MDGRTMMSFLPDDYRAEEMALLVSWIASGESGSVLGLPGVGRSTLLDYLCQRSQRLNRHPGDQGAAVVALAVDLNNLPDNSLATLYRTLLRSFYEAREQFPPPLQRAIRDLFYANRYTNDAFVAQTALRQLLLLLEARQTRIVWVLNRFDDFCREATPQMTRTLVGLRDSFKSTLALIAGMQQEVIYLSDLPALDPLHHLLDAHVCWIGPLNVTDAQNMVQRHTQRLGLGTLPQEQTDAILALSGRFPSLIRVLCQRLLQEPGDELLQSNHTELLQREEIRYRLQRLWNGLTQEEQSLLARFQDEVLVGGVASAKNGRHDAEDREGVWQKLVTKGVCRSQGQRWQVNGKLLSCYVAQMAGHSRGRLWIAERKGEVYQGTAPVQELAPLEQSVLSFFLKHPYRRHTHTAIIEAAWPSNVVRDGVSTEALYQIIRGIRKKIEPDTAHPRYLINWRGTPEGGYQFFPEGRPD